MGLAEFLTYPEAYLLKLIAPTLVPIFIAALAQAISNKTTKTFDDRTRGFIDESMAGLAKNFSIECPNCGEINWYPTSGKKPNRKNKQMIV